MEINLIKTERGGVFTPAGAEEGHAEMVYTLIGKQMVIEHTAVDSSLQGHGIGNRLVRAGVEYARENELKIIPACPFAKAMIEKTPEFQDVLR
ncbi:MAG: GNAT family N-acetyltransferase [Pyrinomonadaceae bacterium]